MPQKYSNIQWEDDTPKYGNIQWEDASGNDSLLDSWNNLWINRPLTGNYFTKKGRETDELLKSHSPSYDLLSQQINDYLPGVGTGLQMMKGFGEGINEGIGSAIDFFSSPLNLASMGLGTVESAAVGKGLPLIAKTAGYANKALGLPMMAAGAGEMKRGYDTGDYGKAFMGFTQLAGGGAQTLTPIHTVPAKEPYVAPDFNPRQIPLDAEWFDNPIGGVDESGQTGFNFSEPAHNVIQPKEPRSGGQMPSASRPNGPTQTIGDTLPLNDDGTVTVSGKNIAAIQKLRQLGYEVIEADGQGNVTLRGPDLAEQEMRLAPGQTLSNRDMFQLSEEIGARNRPEQPTAQLPHEFAPDLVQQNEPFEGGYSPQFAPRTGGINLMGEQEMRVPNVSEGVHFESPGDVSFKKNDLPNVAMGGGSPRVLQVLGSSLYSRDRPTVVAKELLQNAFDEHRIAGVTSPIKVMFENNDANPTSGEASRSMTIRDNGRGLPPKQLYSVFTDVGETGKAGEASASGGFGFAKAAPFLGGQHVEVRSTVDTPQGRVQYYFDGNPKELINQAQGVPINSVKVGNDVPTGLQVKVYFDPKEHNFYEARNFVEKMTKHSPSITSDVMMADEYGDSAAQRDRIQNWLDKPQGSKRQIGEPDFDFFQKEDVPPLQDTFSMPGAEVKLHYENPERGYEASRIPINVLNKGLYQAGTDAWLGQNLTNIPRSIVADIVATVEEGHGDYPFTANREQLNTKVAQAIDKWVETNIASGAKKKAVAALQKKYDSIASMSGLPRGGSINFLDEGGRFTPDEIAAMQDSQAMGAVHQVMSDVNRELMRVADNLGWSTKPSDRLKKFGILYQAPDAKGTVLGVHIPRPDDLNSSAIMVNLFEHMNEALKSSDPMDRLATGLFTTMTHELAHVPGGGHDTSFAYRHAQLLEELGRRNTNRLLDRLGGVFDDGGGGINPEISDFLSVYNESRQRKPTSDTDALLTTGINEFRPSNTSRGQEGNATGANGSGNEPSTLRQLYELPRGLLSALDISATMKQGMPFIGTKQWFDAWGPMFSAMKSDKAYDLVMARIKSDPMMRGGIDLNTGKRVKSFAEEAGLAITDMKKSLSNREESQRSLWAEKIPYVKGSNRAYNAFLNNLRFDTFKSLVEQAAELSKTDKNTPNPYQDKVFAKEIADFVNTGSGRGPMRTQLPSIDANGRVHMKERSLEQNAKIISDIFFAPRLISSRVRMLNPATYVMASPFVRKQYLAAILRTAGAWGTIAGLGYMAGADVSMDPNSADFGKIKVGNTRLDPGAGFQQYLVAASRLFTGRTTSSASGRDFELGQGYRAETRGDVAQRFVSNKFHPWVKFGYDMMRASKYQPFYTGDRIAQMFPPMITQDLLDIVRDDPKNLWMLGPMAAGMGTQSYAAGESPSRLIPEDLEPFKFTGGSFY